MKTEFRFISKIPETGKNILMYECDLEELAQS